MRTAIPPLARRLATILATFAAAAPAGAGLPAGDHLFKLAHRDRTRSYLVHVPPSGKEPKTVVLNLHGGGGNAKNQQSYSRMDAVADRRGFVTVYPNGTGLLSDRLLTWNAGTCCGYAHERNADDVGFVRAVIADLAARIALDRERIYATGLSNGAMMAYRLAAEAPDLVAAIGPVAGAMVALPFRARRPVPVMHIHSVDDPSALYAGGVGPAFPFTSVQVLHPAVTETLVRWTEFNRCAPQAKIDPPLFGAGKSAGHSAVRQAWGSCSGGAEVVHWKLSGAGHVWPGGDIDYLPRLLGAGTDVIDANEVLWEFFSGHRLTRTNE